MSEHGDSLRETHKDQISDAVKRRDALQSLLASPGWEIVNEWLLVEISQRRRAYEEGAPHTMNDSHIIGFQRAQLGMLRTLQDMPTKLCEAEEAAIEQVKLAIGDEDA